MLPAGPSLAAALGGFWRLRSATPRVGRGWRPSLPRRSDRGVERGPDRGITVGREIAGLSGDPVTAEARLSESLALARRVGDKRGIAAALGAIGSALFQHIDVASSIAPFTEAVDLFRELGDLRQTAFLQAFLGGLSRIKVIWLAATPW